MSGNRNRTAISGRLPLKAKYAMANWAKDKAAMLSPPLKDSTDAVAAIRRELGIETTPWVFRTIVTGMAGLDLSRIIRHHGVGAANPASIESIAKRKEAKDVPAARTGDIDAIHARIVRMEAVLDALAGSLGIAVPPPIKNARNGGEP